MFVNANPRVSAIGTAHASSPDMWTRIKRLFTIKTKFEAFLVIYGLGLGAVERGVHYLQQYPGAGGWLLFAVCPIAVFMVGGKLLDAIERESERDPERGGGPGAGRGG